MPLPVIFTAAGVSGLLATAVKYIVGYAIARVVAALGIGLVTFKALDVIAELIVSYVETNTQMAGGEFWHVAVAMGVPHAIKVITSAYVAAITIRQLMGIYNRITFGKAD